MKHLKGNGPSGLRLSRGVSLIELMIALVLGLLVVGAAIGIFISNRQTFRATENLGRVQENARTAFELMARDVREAGGNACSNELPVANVVTPSADPWDTTWATPVLGFDNGALAGSLAGTDAIQLLSSGSGAATVTLHNAASTVFTLANADHGFAANNVLMVCDPQQLSIFRASSVAGASIGHAASGGNCSDSLGVLPVVCAAPAYTHSPNSVITRLRATRWYVAENPRGGNSLYQDVSGTVGEIAEGVQDMQITYLQTQPAGIEAYVDAGAVTDWNAVRAARFVIDLEGQDRVGTDGNPLQRQLIHVVTLRNRNP